MVKQHLFIHLGCGGQLIETGVVRAEEMQYGCERCKHGGGLLTPDHELAQEMYEEGNFEELPKVVELERYIVTICQLLIPRDEWQRVLKEDVPKFLEEQGFTRTDSRDWS